MDLTTLLLLGGGLVIIIIIIGLVITSRSERGLVEERLGKYLEEEEKPEKKGKQATTAVTGWVSKQVEKTTWGERIARDLARADIKLKPGEFLFIYAGVVVGLAGLAYLLGGRNIVSALIGMVFGFILPRIYINRQKNRRLTRFNDQLADMLNLMVNGLRAGYSTLQALEAVSKELPPPISEEFRRVVQEVQLGISLERALDNLLRRIPSEDLDFVVTAINVQREVGGNLAEILDVISYTIRERVRLKGEIRVLTTQVSYSSRILSLLPVGVLLVLWFINQQYVMEFFRPENRTCGLIALGVAGVMIVIGYVTMQRIANIEV